MPDIQESSLPDVSNHQTGHENAGSNIPVWLKSAIEPSSSATTNCGHLMLFDKSTKFISDLEKIVIHQRDLIEIVCFK